MRRREFITLLGGAAAAGPLGASAQQAIRPVIGFVSSSNASPSSATVLLDGFRQGLNEGGYVEGRNLAIEYRWGGGRADRLPELLADLVRRQVNLIVASGGFASAMAAKAATETIPILFIAGFDPVKVGLVKSLSRPGGNATGVSVHTIELVQKRLELLLDLAGNTDTVALLVSPNPYGSDLEIEYMEQAAHGRGLRLLVMKASAESEFEGAFASATRQRAGVLIVSGDPFFTPRRAQLVALAARHRLPAAYPWRGYVEVGGLMSYGPTLTWAYERLGDYAGRILKGARPRDLPVLPPSEFQLIINLKTARALGLTIPRTVHALVNEFIE
jgi:putative ABC transport system substrate-binding protein